MKGKTGAQCFGGAGQNQEKTGMIRVSPCQEGKKWWAFNISRLYGLASTKQRKIVSAASVKATEGSNLIRKAKQPVHIITAYVTCPWESRHRQSTVHLFKICHEVPLKVKGKEYWNRNKNTLRSTKFTFQPKKTMFLLMLDVLSFSFPKGITRYSCYCVACPKWFTTKEGKLRRCNREIEIIYTTECQTCFLFLA